MWTRILETVTDQVNFCVIELRSYYSQSITLLGCLTMAAVVTLMASCGGVAVPEATNTDPEGDDVEPQHLNVSEGDMSAALETPITPLVDGADEPQVLGASKDDLSVLQGPTITLPEGGKLVLVAGNGARGYSGDGGLATEASLSAPYGLTWDPEGNLYIGQDHRISKVDAGTGVITTVAGTGIPGYSGDGGPATEARFGRVQELAFDPSGNLYFADFSNNTIRRVDTNGVITTIVGIGRTTGFSPDGTLGTEAKLNKPFGLAFDSNGLLYFSDGDNNRVRIVDADGTITTVAGTEGRGESGDDGPANAAKLRSPRGLTFDAQGNLYIGTHGGSAIRKVNLDGIITSVTGTDPGAIVAPDSAGQLYIGDWSKSRITRWSPDGTITVLLKAGRFIWDNMDPDDDQSSVHIQPGGLALDAAGNIYVTDDRASHSVYRLEP